MGTKAFDIAELWASLKSGILALLMPVILLGGIYSGWYTVTESAAIAVVYAVAVEALFYRELTFKRSGEIIIENLKMLGALMPLLAIAVSLNNILELDGVPQALVKWMQTYVSSPITLLVITNILLLVAGALMDETSAIIILAPLLAPLGKAYGFHDVHWGTIMIVNLQIGYVAPPVALNLIVAMIVFKEPFGFLCRAVLPFIALMLVALILTCALPQLSLFLLK
jgi:C4-dicarboxylate transporter DctM subunit